MKTNSIETYRNQLKLGDKVGGLITIKHPASGESYAVVVSPERDALLWAAGPLARNDDPQEFIDNQFSGDMEADANWLADELTQHNAWGLLTGNGS